MGETLGRLARDAARRWLGRTGPGSRPHNPYRRPSPEADPWADDDPWEGPPTPPRRGGEPTPADPADPAEPQASCLGRVVVTAVMWAAGWWLRRKYRTVAAVTTAIAAVTAAAWPAADTPVLDTLGAAAEALTAHRAIDTGADALDPD